MALKVAVGCCRGEARLGSHVLYMEQQFFQGTQWTRSENRKKEYVEWLRLITISIREYMGQAINFAKRLLAQFAPRSTATTPRVGPLLSSVLEVHVVEVPFPHVPSKPQIGPEAGQTNGAIQRSEGKVIACKYSPINAF